MKLEQIISDIIKGDQKTISNILQLLNIIKGDQKTISDISSLLQILKEYKKPVQESVNHSQNVVKKPVQQPTQKPVQKQTKREEPLEETDELRANAILEAHFKAGGVLKGKTNYRTMTSLEIPVEKMVEEGKVTKEDADFMSYADHLM